MWGPDLTIRALYITHTLKGGMGERGQERSGHIFRTHLNTLTKAGMHGDAHTVNTSMHALWS